MWAEVASPIKETLWLGETCSVGYFENQLAKTKRLPLQANFSPPMDMLFIQTLNPLARNGV
jgi:hypothetical protein